jgi:hypothetical protein
MATPAQGTLAPRTLITDITVSKLARDIARDLIDIKDILRIHQITLAQYEQIIESKLFQVRLDEEVASWASDAKTRIRAKATTILEEGLVEMFDLVHSPAQPMSAKIEGLKFLAKLSAMEPGQNQVDASEKVIFNITIGAKELHFEQQREDPKVIEGEATLAPAPNPQG